MFLSHQGKSQDTLSLVQCLRLAESVSPEIKANILKADQYMIREKINQREFIPRVNFFATHNYYFGNATDPTTFEFINRNVQTNTFQLSATYSLTNYLLSVQSKNYLTTGRQLEKVDESINRQETRFRTRYTYYKILKQEKALSFLLAKRESLDSLLASFQILLENGLTDKERVLTLRVERSKESVRILELQQQIRYDYTKLETLTKAIIGKIEDISENELLDEYQTVNVGGQLTKPSLVLERLRLEQKQQEAQTKIRKLNSLPDFYVNTALRSNYNNLAERVVGEQILPNPIIGFADSGQLVRSLLPSRVAITERNTFVRQMNENKNFYVGVGLSWRLSNLYGSNYEDMLHTNNMEQLENDTEVIERERLDRVRNLQNELDSYRSIYYIQKSNLVMLEDILQIKRDQLLKGLITTNDYIISKRELTKAKIEQLDTIFDLVFAANEVKYQTYSLD